MAETYLPVLLLLVFALGFAAALLVLASGLGPRARDPRARSGAKQEPSTSRRSVLGSPPTFWGYEIALIFVLLSTGVAFVYPWIPLLRELTCSGSRAEAGTCTGVASPLGLLCICAWLASLALGLAQAWRHRPLDWT